jgi:hypothetical protein
MIEVLDEVEVHPGEDWAFASTITDKITGAAINLTGYALESTISTTPPLVGTVVVISAPLGQVEVQVLNANTDDVGPGHYLADIRTQTAGGISRIAKRFWVVVKPTPSLP